MKYENDYGLQRWQEQFHNFFMQENISLEQKFTWVIEEADFDGEMKKDETHGDLLGARGSVVVGNKSPIALESIASESSVYEELSDIETRPTSSIIGNRSSPSFNFQADLKLFDEYALSSDEFEKNEEFERKGGKAEEEEVDVESIASSATFITEPLTKRKKKD